MDLTALTVTGLVPGRSLRIESVAVRDGDVELRYVLRPGISREQAQGASRTLLPRLALVPGGPVVSVQGGFEPGAGESAGDLHAVDPRIVAGEPLTLLLTSPADPAVSVALDLGPYE